MVSFGELNVGAYSRRHNQSLIKLNVEWNGLGPLSPAGGVSAPGHDSENSAGNSPSADPCRDALVELLCTNVALRSIDLSHNRIHLAHELPRPKGLRLTCDD